MEIFKPLAHALTASAFEPMPKMEAEVNCSIDESSFGSIVKRDRLKSEL